MASTARSMPGRFPPKTSLPSSEVAVVANDVVVEVAVEEAVDLAMVALKEDDNGEEVAPAAVKLAVEVEPAVVVFQRASEPTTALV